MLGLYKGMLSPLIGQGIINAIVFGVEAQAKGYLGKETIGSEFVSGMLAGAVQSIVCSPMELAKTQMQVQGIGQRKATEKVSFWLAIYANAMTRSC